MSPLTTRQHLVRYHDQAQNDLDRVLRNLQNMAKIYDEKYPIHTTTVEQISKVVIGVKDLLQRFRDEEM